MYRKRITVSGIILTLLLQVACFSGATVSSPVTTVPTANPTVTAVQTGSTPAAPIAAQRCGNGICEKAENPLKCPADCPPQKSPAENEQETTPAVAPTPDPQQPTVLYLGLMVHLEGWNDDQDQARFEQHARLLGEYASLFETYGAKLTLESKEMTPGSAKWGDNILLQMQQRGHGIGVHADIGGEKNYPCRQMSEDLRQKKLELEALGVTVRHLSGNVSTCDWVTASIDAGYAFTTGTVAYGLMSLPLAKRPAEYRNCVSPAACHQVYPTDLAGRLHPWRANSGTDWIEPSANGRLIILPASGGLKCMDEDQNGQSITGKGCQYTREDINLFFKEVDQALTLLDPNQVNIYYNSWSFGEALDQTLLEEWLQRLQPYIDSGRVQWKTLPEMYDIYMARQVP